MELSLVLIVSIVAVTVVAWGAKSVMGALVLVPARVMRGEVHRLLTAGWVHADVAHLAFNMFTLYFFAGEVAKKLGVVQFLLLYVSAVVVGYVPTTLRHARNPRYVSLGASGAVAAAMFAAILLDPRIRLGLLFLPILVPGWVYAIVYLAYSAWQSVRGADGVNHSAHFWGAIYGALVTFLLEPARVTRTIQTLLGS